MPTTGINYVWIKAAIATHLKFEHYYRMLGKRDEWKAEFQQLKMKKRHIERQMKKGGRYATYVPLKEKKNG